MQSDIVALGCELSASPPRADPDSAKLWPVLNAIAELQRAPIASPLGVNGLLGGAQWFCVFSRPHFLCFSTVYEFVRRTPESTLQTVPQTVIDEFLIFAGLAPLLSADLDRQRCTTVVATHAAPEFGLGVSIADMAQSAVAQLGTLSERQGDYVRPFRDGSTAVLEKSRLGTPHRFPFRQEDFRDVFYIRAERREHSGSLDLKGVL